MKLDELPFLVARNNDELYNNIISFDNDIYCKKLDEYFTKVGLVKDGHATEKIVKMITEFIYKNK